MVATTSSHHGGSVGQPLLMRRRRRHFARVAGDVSLAPGNTSAARPKGIVGKAGSMQSPFGGARPDEDNMNCSRPADAPSSRLASPRLDRE